nr:uncharacterized protein LOC129380671 [Dermacentor andersoni]
MASAVKSSQEESTTTSLSTTTPEGSVEHRSVSGAAAVTSDRQQWIGDEAERDVIIPSGAGTGAAFTPDQTRPALAAVQPLQQLQPVPASVKSGNASGCDVGAEEAELDKRTIFGVSPSTYALISAILVVVAAVLTYAIAVSSLRRRPTDARAAAVRSANDSAPVFTFI